MHRVARPQRDNTGIVGYDRNSSTLRDPRERILGQEGDFLILQQAVDEGIAQWFTTNFRFNILAYLVRQRDFIFTNNTTLP